MSSTTCPLCGSRKAKRACPALDRAICAVCCGTKRLTEINCPATCSYLAAARNHPPAVVQRRQDRDLRFFLPLISDLTEIQYQLLLVFQGTILRHAAGAIPPLRDDDVAAAATAVAATFETAGKGIIYQHQADSIPAQRLASAIEAAVRELLGRAGSQAAALERDAAIGLRRIAKAAQEAARALPDEEPPAYLKLIGRLMTPAAGAADATEAPATEPGSRGGLIIPG